MGQIGVMSLITANAMMVSPFCTAGMPATWIREFPSFKDDPIKKNQYFSYQLLVVLALNVVVISAGYLLKDWIASRFVQETPEYIQYLGITAIIIVVNSLFEHLNGYCRTILQIIFPSFLRDVFLRLAAIVLVGGFAMNFWDFETAARGLAINYVSALILLYLYLLLKHKLKFTFSFDLVKSEDRRNILNYGGFFMLMALSFAILNNASIPQIASHLGDDAAGIFTTCFFIGVVIEMPQRNMLKVLSPIFSKAMKEYNMTQVERMYQKGSVTMGVFGCLLFIGIVTNIDDLFSFIPQGSGFATGYWIVIGVCATKLISMIFSFSSEIIVFSEKFRYILIAQLIAALILVATNEVLLPRYGLESSAISYFLGYMFFVLIKFIWTKNWFGISPFTSKHLHLSGISILVLALFFFLPIPFGPVFSIVVRSILTTILFTGLIYAFKVSEDINSIIEIVLVRLKILRPKP